MIFWCSSTNFQRQIPWYCMYINRMYYIPRIRLYNSRTHAPRQMPYLLNKNRCVRAKWVENHDNTELKYINNTYINKPLHHKFELNQIWKITSGEYIHTPIDTKVKFGSVDGLAMITMPSHICVCRWTHHVGQIVGTSQICVCRWCRNDHYLLVPGHICLHMTWKCVCICLKKW